MVATRSRSKAAAPEPSTAFSITNDVDVPGSSPPLSTAAAHTNTDSRVASAKKPKLSKRHDEETSRDGDEFAEPPSKTKRKTAAAKPNSASTARRKPSTQQTGRATRGKASKGKTKVKDSASGPATPDSATVKSTTILDLPPEIRNDIWTMAIVQDAPIPIAPIRPFLKEPALLAVSRQVRSETMSIWYAEHNFTMMGSSPAVKFLRSRNDQQLRSIRSLCITSEKSDQMKQAPRAWLDHLRNKIETLMREFDGRGFRRQALRFQVMSGGQLQWINGETMQVCEVQGYADKGKRIRAGPRKEDKVPGRGSQPAAVRNPPT